MGRRGRAAVVVAPVMVGLLACGGVDGDDGAPPLAHHPQAQPGVAAPASGAAPSPGASSPAPAPPASEPSRPPPPISPAVSPPPVVVPPPELFPSLAPTATPPPPPRPEDMGGSTFTITSLGAQGGLLATPVINHPEVAILGVHRIRPTPVVRDGQIVARDVMHLSLSSDHRVVDGHVAAAFTYEVVRYLEDPNLLFMELV